MSHFINDEQSIFAYRKLIDLLSNRTFSLFDNFFIDKQLCSEMGLYDKSPISIIANLYEFIFEDERDQYIKIKVTTSTATSKETKKSLKEGLQYLIDFYVQIKKAERKGLFSPHLYEELRIIEDYTEISELNETDNIEFIKQYLSLLFSIYQLESPIYEQIIYNSGISIKIQKGEKFGEILLNGSFIKNLEMPIKPFERSFYGKYGDHLLSFSKQLDIVKRLIHSKLEHFNVNDILLTPQVKPEARKALNGVGDLTEDACVRLFDCLFYLEYKGEIKFTELLPTRIVIDASNLTTSSSQQNILKCGKLSIDKAKCMIGWDGDWYRNISIGNKSIKMLILLLQTPESVVKYKTIVNESQMMAKFESEPQVVQQYKNQLVKDLLLMKVPERIAIQIRDMIKPVKGEGYRIASN